VRARALIAGLFLLLSAAVAPTVGAGQAWRERALAAFDEVWQTVDETYPDPAFGGLDWTAIRDEMRPRAERADSPEAVRELIREMLARFGESHFALLSAGSGSRIRGEARVAVDLRVVDAGFVIVSVTPDSSASAAGLAPGQIVTSIDDEPASSWLEAAEGPDARRRALDALRATLQVTDLTGDKTVVAARERERGQVVRFGNLPPLAVRVDSFERATPAGRRVGVIAFNLWMPAASAGIDAAVDRFRDAAGLVIDLRGNPGGLVEMMRGVAGHLIDEAVPLGRMRTRQAELALRVNPRRSTSDGRSVDPFAGPVAILVDELTASASECFSGSLQSLGRARIFGRQTMGQALPAATRRLGNGDVLMHVLGDFVTPTGVRLEGRGVIPDETVPLLLDELRAGRDGALEAALAWIDREVGGGR
jgi:carboxyl-terminal processing protease